MARTTFDADFGRVWQQLHVAERQGYHTSVADFHRHRFYEINLILSGNVKVLLGDRSEEGCESRIVLTRPDTPHYVTCRPDTLYHRLYLLFTDNLVAGYLPEWAQLSTVFGEQGTVLTLTDAQTALLGGQILRIREERSLFRQRLMVYDLLSRILDLKNERQSAAKVIPAYILEALCYLDEHYAEKIVAESLARQLHVGRTTLMTEFKRHVGTTMIEYLTQCRLRHATELLRAGKTTEDTAAQCGFADASGLSRAFKRCYGKSPRAYLAKKEAEIH